MNSIDQILIEHSAYQLGLAEKQSKQLEGYGTGKLHLF